MNSDRPIGLLHATAMVAGIIIGASIFVQPSEVNRHVPTISGVLSVWLAAGILTLFGALVCAQLSAAFPRTGGVYVFLKETLSPALGFLWGWAMFWSAHSGIIAAAKLVFSGIPERYPRIKFVLGHLGGAIPYLAERLDRGYEAFRECRANIPRPPSTYLKQFYFDTVNFDPKCIQLAIDFAGIDHIVAGSDYPHQIGSIPKMIHSIGDRADTFAANARRILKLA